MDPCEFDDFVAESTPALDATTYRRNQKVHQSTSTPIPHHSFIFLTLFWLRHYLTIEVLSFLFKLHKQDCTRVLKQTTAALAKVLENDIQWPSDDEMNNFCNSEFQNLGFSQCVCIIDDTEIRISRPKNSKIQTDTWSGKKK